MVPNNPTMPRESSPSFIGLIISGVGLFVGFLSHAPAVFLPIWFSRGYGLWNVDPPSEYHWFYAVRAMELLGLIFSLIAAILFIFIMCKSSAIRWSMPLEPKMKLILFAFVGILFLSGVAILSGIIVAVKMIGSRDYDGYATSSGYFSYVPPTAVAVSGSAGLFFLMSAGLAAKSATDSIFLQK